MKAIKVIVPVLALIALTFALAGCPKGDDMMGQAPDAPAQMQQVG